ncbi:MAG: hypothetical protein ACR2OD_07590, partial [Gaiellaceae bacterium]
MSLLHVLAYLDSNEVGGAEQCLRSVIAGLDGEYRYTVAGVSADVVDWVAGASHSVEQLVLPEAPTKTSFAAGLRHVRA